MTRDEIIEFLRDNLSVVVEQNNDDFYNPNRARFTVKLKLVDEVISEDWFSVTEGN